MVELIQVRGLSKTYGKLDQARDVLKNIDLDVRTGELVVLIGASGCGKSTLLRCLNGLEEIDSGTITVGPISYRPEFERDAQKLKALRSRFGMVFQSFNLFPHLRLIDNVTIAPRVVRQTSAPEAKEKALALLEKVGLAGHVNHYPSQLSGGQQQRAAIARALAMTPEVMLYDEPTSALDPHLVEEVFRVMKQLKAEGMTQILVTHELAFAREVADRVVFLSDGRIVEQGPPQAIFRSPKSDLTQQFVRRFMIS